MSRWTWTLVLLAASCTDASLYGRVGQEPRLADKLTLTGLLCTDTPAARAFPVKLLFLVDASGAMQEAAPFGEHVRAIEAVLAQNLPNRFLSVGVVRYGDRARSLVTETQARGDTGFTRDESLLDTALTDLRTAGGARDLAAGLGLARSVLTGDAFLADRGPLSRTKYIVVHLTTGAPSPPIPPSRCDALFAAPPEDCERAFLAQAVRNLRDELLAIGAGELVFHTAHLEPVAVEGRPCDPRAGARDCGAQTCVQVGARVDTGRCVELCNPDAPACVGDPARPACLEVPVPNGVVVAHCGRPAETSCFDGVDNDGDGQDMDCSDPNYPLDCEGQDGCEVDCLSQCRMAAIGVDMALAAAGSYERFGTADRLDISRIDYRSTQRRFALKNFLVDNRNSIPTAEGLRVDSDGDGLSDEAELRIEGVDADGVRRTLDPLSADTDGDFFSDRVEHLLRTVGLDPFIPNLPPGCDDPTVDRDGDGLTDCEEQLLGSDSTLFDTDGDGIPDGIEVRRGTNVLVADVLDDLDQDGVPNGIEISAHTDVTSNDARVRAELAQRTRVVTSGVTGDQRTCYDLRVSNISLVETLDRGFGPGNNDVEVYFGQVPEDELGSLGLWSVAQVRVRYVAPDVREPDSPVLDLVEGDFVFVGE